MIYIALISRVNETFYCGARKKCNWLNAFHNFSFSFSFISSTFVQMQNCQIWQRGTKLCLCALIYKTKAPLRKVGLLWWWYDYTLNHRHQCCSNKMISSISFKKSIYLFRWIIINIIILITEIVLSLVDVDDYAVVVCIHVSLISLNALYLTKNEEQTVGRIFHQSSYKALWLKLCFWLLAFVFLLEAFNSPVLCPWRIKLVSFRQEKSNFYYELQFCHMWRILDGWIELDNHILLFPFNFCYFQLLSPFMG